MTEYENFEKAVEAMLKNHGPQDTVQYVINGDNVVRRLKLEDGKDVIGYDQFKARVAKENCISQTLATRIKLYTPNFFNYIKEFNEEGDGLHGGSDVVIGLNGPSPAVEMMLRFLAYPRASAEGKECAWLGKDLDTERFRETPAEFGDLWIKALSSSTDTAFLTLYASTELDTYQKALAEAEKCEQEQGSCAAAAVAGRAACAEVLASTLRGFSYMTLVPESLESLVSLPPCFPVIVKAFKALAGKFLACPAWRESLAAPIGYALMVFANATPAQYLWGHPGNVRARAAIQPFAATPPFKHLCNSAFKTLDTEDVPRLIIQLIETLAAPGALWHPHHRLLPVLLDTLGAIVCGNKEFLERLVSSTKILKIVSDALTAQDAQDAEAVPANAEGGTDSEATATATTTTTTTTITTAQKNQIEFMFKINAYRFAYFLMSTSNVYEKQVKETKLLERIEDLILWTLSTFKRPAEETQRLREADTEDGYFLSELGRGLVEDLAKAKSPELERLMGCVGHMLAGEIAQACDLLGVLFGAVLRKGSRAYEATVAFPELQFWFVGALKRFVGRDNDRFYKIIYHRYWEQIFSEDLMFIGKTGDAAPLPATRMHVLLRQRLVLFVFELMDIGEGHKVVLAKAHETFDSSAKSPCVEEHVVCVETAASVLSKLALNGSPVAAKDLQALPTFLIEPKSFKDRLAAVSEDPAFDSIRIRYSTARSGTTIAAAGNDAAIDVMFELLNDPLTATFAVNEITRLLSSKPKSSSEGDDSDEEKLHQLCQRYLRYIETFNGNEEEERFGVLLSFLRGIEEVCLTAPWRRELFSEKGLFTGLMTLLTFQTPRHPERKATIVDECLRIIYYFDEATFEAAIGYAHLKVVLFSFIDYLDQRGIVDRLFENALKTKRKEHWETLAIRYPRFLHIACELLPLMRDEAAVLSVLERLQGLFATLSNVATCCDAGTLGVILDTFEGLARRSENSTGAAAAAATATATATKPTTSHSGASSAANGTIKRLADIAQTLGSYSLSAGDLSHFFRLMSLAATSIITTTTASSSSSSSSEQNKGKGEEGKVGYHRHPQFPYLVRCLHGIASSNIGGPSAYYVFNGTTSHILLPRLERWPFQKGMTFCAWVRIETSEAPTTSTDNNNNNNNNNSSSSSSSNSSSHVDNGRRHICYFADDGASGEENAFDIFISAGGQLVLETTYFGVKEVYGCCSPDSQLPRGKWFFLTMTIAPSTMIPMSGEVKAFINAAQICKVSIRYPKLDMAKYGAIGCRLPAVSPLGFYGQLGAIHFFEDILSSSQILDIYRNGANYTGSFTALDFPCLDESERFDTKLVLNYSCRLSADKVVYNNCPQRPNFQDLEAKVENIMTCKTTKLKDVITCVEGIKVLFPLFLVLGEPGECEAIPDKELFVQMFKLIHEIMLMSIETTKDMIRSKGYQMLSHIFRRVPRELFSVELVKAIEGAYKKMQVKELRDAFYYGFITNFFVWIRAPVEVQKALIGLVFKMHQTMGREMNVQKTLSIIRLFYWITRKRTSLAASSRDQRPGTEDIFQLRRALFAIIKARLSGEVHRDDVAALVSFILNAAMPLNGVSKEQQQQQQQQQQSTLGTGSNSGPATPAMSPVPGEGHGEAAVTVSELDENDDGDIPSALKIIIDILSSKSITFAEQLFGNGGVEALMQALWVPSEKIRVLAIEALSRLTYVLLGAPALQGTERHYVREIATSLWYVLARVPGGMTEGLYSALLRMAVSDFSCKSPVTVSEKSTRLVFPEVVFLAILPLLKDCPRDLRLRAYRDLGAILGRDLNCRKVLIFAGWQHYLCKTIDVERRLGDEEAHAGACSALGLIIQELVFAAAEYLLGWDPIRDFFAVFAHFDSYVGGGDEFFIDVHIAFSKAYLARIVKAIKGETPENIRAIISPASEQFATVISTLVYITDFFLIYAPSVSTPYIHSVKFFLKNLATTRARPEQGEQQQQQQQSQSSPRGKIGTAVGATATATPAASPAKQQQGKIPVPEPPQSPSGRPAPPSIPSSPVNAHAMAPQLPQGSPMKGVEGEGNAVDAVEERAGEQEQQEQQQQQLQKETAAAKRRADRAQGEVLVLSQILGYVDYFRLPAVGGWAGAEKSRLGSPMLRTRGSGFIGMSVEICVRLVQVFALVGSVDHGKKCYAALLFLSTIASDYIPQHGSIQSQFHYILDTSLISFTLSIENRMAEITNELFKFFGKLTETLGEVKKLSKLVSKQNCPAIEVLISKAQHGSVEELAEFLKTDSWKKAGEEIRAKAQAYVQFTLSVYDKAIAIRRDSMYAVIDLIKAGAHTMRPFAASDAMLSAAKDDNRRIEKLSRKLTDINDESSHGWTKAAKGMIFGSGPWKVSSQSSVWCVDKAENSSRMRLKVRRDFENEKRDTTTAAAAAAAAAPKSKEEKEKQAHNEELVLKAARTNTGRVIHKEDFRVTRSDVEKWVSETDGPDKVALRVECEYIRPNKTVHGVFVVSADDSEITFREVGFREIGAAVTAVAAAATATATIMTMRLAKLAGITAAAASATSGSSSTSTSSAVGQRKVGKDNDAGKRMVALLIGDESGDGNSSNIAIRGGAAKEGQRQQKRQKRRITKTWKRGALRAVHMRRYRLAHTALEVFFDDSTSVFLNFATPDVKMYVYRKLVTIMPSIAATSATPLPLRYVDCATPAETLCSATVAAGMTQQWVKGQLSNFDYLMCLNTIAGRSYNDIDQYPVFPWVLADYISEVLDLTNPKTFRDLSKPIGALIPKVRASNGEAAAAAYPSMYSSADIVLHYMARLEPFASCPRTSAAASAPVFRSVREEWEACISNGNGGNDDDDDKEEEDRFFPYRELTPEFFCSPEFLRNGGEALADVELPPWAHGSADEFVRVHRAALESEYVSAHLHEWIDLIFGYKQTGGEARKADNVFFWSSYEGAIDLAKVPHSDRAAVVRAATRRGLAPAMLLAGPHPAKSNSNSNNKTLFADPENVRSWTVGLGSSVAPPPANGSGSGREEGAAGSAPFITRPLLPVAHVRMFEGIPVYKHIRTTYVDMVGTVNSLGACGVHSFGAPQKGSESAFRVEIDTALTERTASLGRDRAWSFAGSNSNSNSNSSVTSKQFAFTPDAQYLFECGFWDNSLRFVSVKTGQVLQTLKEHRDTVTCVAVAPGGDFVFTGSRDTTLMCWAIHWPANGVDDPSVSPHPRYVLCGHAAPVTALDFSADLDLVVSGDESGTIVAHTLREGRFIWAARLAKGGSSPISHVRIAGPRGDVVAYSRAAYTLAEYNINGRLLCRTELAAPFNDIAVSADGGYIVLGGHNAIMLRAVQNLRLVYNYSIQGTVTSLSLFGGDRCLAAGMLEGNLLIINKKQ